jgi:hypothetical protein
MTNTDTEFDSIEKVADKQKLINCYQMQIIDDICKPVNLGFYPELPLPVNKVIKYNNYVLNIVTYILSHDEVIKKLFKIIGIMVFKIDKKESICSLDLILNEKNVFQLIFNDHGDNTTKIIETLDKIPKKENLLEYIIEKAFEEPIRSIILQ